MNDFAAEPPVIRRAMLDAADRVFRSGWYILGKEVLRFEEQWARACGVARAIGVANGLDAIEIALRAMGLGPGDEVIVPSVTAFATVLGVMRAGCVPVIADIEPESGLMSMGSAKRCLSGKSKAVLLVHLYGQVRAMDGWLLFCAREGLMLIEDCAQSHLACWQGKFAGSFGAAGAYSFYPTKNLGAIGDAGALVTNDGQLAERAARLRNYGQSVRYHHPELGMNSRLDELQAALLTERMRWLEEQTARRRVIAVRYRSEIVTPSVVQLSAPEEPEAHAYHLYVVACGNRPALQAHLEERGVQSLIHYPVPIHRQVPCLSLAKDPEGLHDSERFADSCLSIPCHPNMPDNQVEHVIRSVNEFRGA